MSAHDHVPPVADPAQDPAPDPSAAPDRTAGAGPLPGPAAPPAGPGKLPRAVGVTLATAGLLAVTATSAAVTVAVGRPDARPAASATAAAAPTASATASASATTAPPAAPAPGAGVPSPADTVRGTVSGGRHDGDLRFFLLPIPEGGESYGPAEGMPVTDEELAGRITDGAEVITALRALGFKDAATRTYRTKDGKAEVTVTLMRFATAARAGEFARSYTMDLPPVEISGDPAARGYLRKPEQKAYTGSMSGISSQGDVQYVVDVDVKGDPDKALLNELMKRQRDWLTSGR
ncbi:hypothetical protein ACFCX4_21365 [Kitasatospora sp. NPDC056327]|uniref:hypothetical protein n=1 Tax=Kitasatospora sp. NPDC056327 TaxID=3345785 RepID=UPI0035DF7542